MSNGSEACCALGIYCPPAQRKPAIVKILTDDGVDPVEADKAADVLMAKFVFADPSLAAFVDSVVAMTKAHG